MQRLSAYAHQSDHGPASYSPTLGSNTTASTSSYSSQPRPARANAKVKLCCVGDGGVGKTCLLVSYAENRFPEEYVPTVFENYVTNVPVNDRVVEFALWDTAGQEEYDRLRPLSYPETDVLLVCFAVDYRPSLGNVEDKWWPEVAHFCEGVPIILVATKIDLRKDATAIGLIRAQGNAPVSYAEGAAMAQRMGAQYAEVSALRGEGVQEVFDLALREAMAVGRRGPMRGLKRKVKCTIL